jgi:hypothetical protein
VRVHIYSEGGKARSWNRFLFDDLTGFHETHIFVDGDAEIMSGSIDALHLRAWEQKHGANAASGMPMNGRRMDHTGEPCSASIGPVRRSLCVARRFPAADEAARYPACRTM